jgi:hypothetical protein
LTVGIPATSIPVLEGAVKDNSQLTNAPFIRHSSFVIRHSFKVLVEVTLLAGMTWWVFHDALRDPFHFDDSLFLQSPQVTNPGDPLYLLKPAQTRQLTYLTFYWNYRLGGSNPAGYHLVNLLLHLLNTLGVYLFVWILIRTKDDIKGTLPGNWLPLAAAAIFALHPLQSEPVNYVYQRSTLLAGLFALAAMCFYLRSETHGNRRLLRIGAGVCWILASASKESALVLPFVLATYLWA